MGKTSFAECRRHLSPRMDRQMASKMMWLQIQIFRARHQLTGCSSGQLRQGTPGNAVHASQDGRPTAFERRLCEHNLSSVHRLHIASRQLWRFPVRWLWWRLWRRAVALARKRSALLSKLQVGSLKHAG